MDSPYLQSTSNVFRPRTNSSLSVHSSSNPTGIRKRSVSRGRSISASQTERLHQLILDGSTTPDLQPLPPTSANAQWFTPQPSPQPQLFPDSSLVETLPQWAVPTPPRSDSGVPSLSIDAREDPLTTCVSSSQDYTFQTNTTTAEMSSLGFLLPSQYGNGLYDSESNSFPMNSSYSSMPSQSIASEPSPYGQTVSSSPALYQSRPVPSSDASRRHSEFPAVSSADSSYISNFRRISSPYDSNPMSDYSMSQGQTIPSISGLTQSPLPSPHLGSNTSRSVSHYGHNMSKSPSMYDSSAFGHSMTTAPPATQYRTSSQSMSYPPAFVASNASDVMSKPVGSESQMRVLNQRPKPQCWEHGCNGRQFSTFSNLLRHQREKSGTASKSYCPRCGAEFTRTTARNGHLAHDKCQKTRRASDELEKAA